MKRLLPYLVLGCVSILLLMYFLTSYTPQQAGDIANYLGVTESVKNHFSPELRDADKEHLATLVHPSYFQNPIYYNIPSPSGQRYSMHFIAYSYLITPVRMALEFAHYNPLLVFPIANSIILILTLTVLLTVLRDYKQRLILLTLVLLSPMLSFIAWPGPDLWVLCLLLVGAYLYHTKRYWSAAYVIALASWHSQPLMILAIGSALVASIHARKGIVIHKSKSRNSLQSVVTQSMWIICIMALPYIYNFWAFGVVTPWTKLQDGWTLLYGFGLQNLRVEKFISQLFDINTGIFWYAPIPFLSWIAISYKSLVHKQINTLVLTALLIITAFLYQTNPAFHYGTAGYGPSRHIVFLVPFLIYMMLDLLASVKKRTGLLLLALFVISQSLILTMNGWLSPDFTKSLYHTPIASYVLTHAPTLYTPLPEIFVDRTNHQDLDHPTSAIFRTGDVCKKAFTLATDLDRLLDACRQHATKSIGTIYNQHTDGIYTTYE